MDKFHKTNLVLSIISKTLLILGGLYFTHQYFQEKHTKIINVTAEAKRIITSDHAVFYITINSSKPALLNDKFKEVLKDLEAISKEKNIKLETSWSINANFLDGMAIRSIHLGVKVLDPDRADEIHQMCSKLRVHEDVFCSINPIQYPKANFDLQSIKNEMLLDAYKNGFAQMHKLHKGKINLRAVEEPKLIYQKWDAEAAKDGNILINIPMKFTCT